MSLHLKNRIVNGTNQPLAHALSNHLFYYPTPSHTSNTWRFGSLAGLVFLPFFVGIIQAMHCTPHTDWAFASDVNGGYLFRYFHANGASAVFILIYLHMARNLYYQTYLTRRTLWYSGVVIFLLMMATAFIGYVLPLLGAIPYEAGMVLFFSGPLVPYRKMSLLSRVIGEVRALLKRKFRRQYNFLVAHSFGCGLFVYHVALYECCAKITFPFLIAITPWHEPRFYLWYLGIMSIPYTTGWLLIKNRHLPLISKAIILIAFCLIVIFFYRYFDVATIVQKWGECGKVSGKGDVALSLKIYDGVHFSVYRILDPHTIETVWRLATDNMVSSETYLPPDIAEAARTQMLARLPEFYDCFSPMSRRDINKELNGAFLDAIRDWLAQNRTVTEGARYVDDTPREGWLRWLERRLPPRYRYF